MKLLSLAFIASLSISAFSQESTKLERAKVIATGTLAAATGAVTAKSLITIHKQNKKSVLLEKQALALLNKAEAATIKMKNNELNKSINLKYNSDAEKNLLKTHPRKIIATNNPTLDHIGNPKKLTSAEKVSLRANKSRKVITQIDLNLNAHKMNDKLISDVRLRLANGIDNIKVGDKVDVRLKFQPVAVEKALQTSKNTGRVSKMNLQNSDAILKNSLKSEFHLGFAKVTPANKGAIKNYLYRLRNANAISQLGVSKVATKAASKGAGLLAALPLTVLALNSYIDASSNAGANIMDGESSKEASRSITTNSGITIVNE